jgi:zinc transport system permease protein
LAIRVHEEMAAADGVGVGLVRGAFLLLLAFTVAIRIMLVGILLIVALLIFPAATARAFVATPEQMAVGAAGVSMVSVLAGLGMSLQLDTPAGPSIVLVMTALFALFLPLLLRRQGG